MKPSTREALSTYYREAGSWASDQIASLQKSRRTAWIIAGVAAGVAVVEGVALIILMPLKTVEPYTLLVDRNTGYVQVLKPLEVAQTTPDQALIQSMLVQYVIARESFDVATVQADYRKVGLWSADTARSDYVARMQASNPSSPLLSYPRSTVVETHVKSVSPLDNGSALVRFDTLRRDAGARYATPQAWVAVVEYRFSGEPMSIEDRYLNPLGFLVSSYRRDAEALPRSEAEVAPSAPLTTEPRLEPAPIGATP